MRVSFFIGLILGFLSMPAFAEGSATSWSLAIQVIDCHVATGETFELRSRYEFPGGGVGEFSGADWNSRFESVLTTLSKLNPSRAIRYRQNLTELLKRTRFLPGVSLKMDSLPSPPKDLPPTCALRVLSILSSADLAFQPRLIVDLDLWNKLSPTDQAAAALEILVADEFRSGRYHYDSEIDRDVPYRAQWEVTSKIMSKSFDTFPIRDWLLLLDKLGFRDGDWQGCRVGLGPYPLEQSNWNMYFLDAPCSVLVQGKKVDLRAAYYKNEKIVEIEPWASVDLSLPNGETHLFKNFVRLNLEGYPISGNLKGAQHFHTGAGTDLLCEESENPILLDSKTGAVLRCEALLPFSIQSRNQQIQLILNEGNPSCRKSAKVLLSFNKYGDWRVSTWESYCDFVARGQFLLGKDWVSGSMPSHSQTGDQGLLHLDQDVQFRIHDIDFSYRRGEDLSVYMDEEGQYLMGGKLSRTITVQTPHGVVMLGGGKCSPDYWKTYDSVALFYPDGSLAEGVIPGDSRFPYFLNDWIDLHGTAKVRLYNDGKLRDTWTDHLCN